ncbi:MAG: RIP metalloprotease RseP [Alphaproteobacteria bacterium]|nr:RIP metalloprotease RseP [Alphaproteobacteria bacterium]OJV45110.1 MAG: RIP metalloprotease RseP [Alphaproteobacteria bacterium 43-37]
MTAITGIIPYLVPFLVVITILVFVHEMGHYLVARWNGVRVEVFSIGFGPELFGWTDRVGTRWKFSLIPLGGYVKMYGDLDAASRPNADVKEMSQEDKALTLHAKKPWQRIAVAAAGPAANYIFAVILLFGLYLVIGQRYLPADISEVLPNTAAANAGLMKGDVIRQINGQTIDNFKDLEVIISSNPGQKLSITIDRQGQTHHVDATPDQKEIKDRFGRVRHVGSLGIARAMTPNFKMLSMKEAAIASFVDTYQVSAGMLHGIWQIIIGERSSEELGGVLRIAKISGEVAQSGLANLLWLMAFLSINLGLINLFPIPMLDGGHIMLHLVEVMTGKPVNEKVQEFAFKVGFSIVIAVMVLAMWNDLMHLGVVKWFLGLWG